MIQEKELSQVDVPGPDMSPHRSSVVLDVAGQYWFDGQNRVGVVCLHDDGIGDVESAKVVPHVFVVFHGQVSEAIEDSFVVRFNRKFGLEERSHNGPCSSVARDILKSFL